MMYRCVAKYIAQYIAVLDSISCAIGMNYETNNKQQTKRKEKHFLCVHHQIKYYLELSANIIKKIIITITMMMRMRMKQVVI